MDYRQLTPDFAVAPQMRPEDAAAIAAAGFRSVICNRPDAEEPGQPTYDLVSAAIAAEGLEVRFQPVVSSAINEADAAELNRLIAELPKPILAYCRTGTRCTVLWNLSRAVAGG